LNEYTKAREYYEQGLTLARDLDELQLESQALVGLGALSYAQGEYEQAIEDYDRAIALDPEFAGAYHNRGVAYRLMDNRDAAIADFERVLELSDDPYWREQAEQHLVENYSRRGNAYADQGEYEQAIEDYDRAIEIDPEYVGAYHDRGIAYFENGEYARAIEDYDRAIEIDPDFAGAHLRRGNAYFENGEYARAIEDYDRAIELVPEFAGAYNNRGNAYADLGEYEQAIEDYDRAIEIDPEDALAYTNRGSTYANLGEYEQAIEDYDRAIEIAPEYARAYNGICWWGSLSGRAGDGDIITACEQVIVLADEENIGFYRDTRGLNRALNGDFAGAIEDFRAFVEYAPENDMDEEMIARREAWIAALEAGENPFDEATLAELREE
jgi:tetratricopeptide (TPR) repeat protein